MTSKWFSTDDAWEELRVNCSCCLTREGRRATKVGILKYLRRRRNAPRRYFTNAPSEARFKVIVFTGLHMQLALRILYSYQNPYVLLPMPTCSNMSYCDVSAQSVLRRRVFISHPVWKTSLFTERSLSMQLAFAFRLFFPKRKAFADIHRNVGIVRSIMIRQRRSSNCNKPVITWPLGHFAPSCAKLASALVAMW